MTGSAGGPASHDDRRTDRSHRPASRLDPVERFGLRVTLIALAVLLAAVPFATLTFQVLDGGAITRFDGRVADSFNRWVERRPGAVGLLEAISYLGLPAFLALVVLFTVVLAWRPGRRRRCIYLLVTAIGGSLLNTLVKVAVSRPRPVVDHPVSDAVGQSFPSGHAMIATVTYGALLVALWPWLPSRLRRPVVGATVVVVILVGTSRLLLGLHFVSDVVGGFILGSAWLAAVTAAFALWRREEPVASFELGGDHRGPSA